ncbi:hypothetical protein FQA47_011467 [Oryzias melastigma]|uniref:Uncharacterized protein n=1 Tax=Oryzias melastigma TaxID=30732 RepID=A0A834FH59_ORYME|nr:hypothetical protein FQA47_011467 [Oryzias melastigma]
MIVNYVILEMQRRRREGGEERINVGIPDGGGRRTPEWTEHTIGGQQDFFVAFQRGKTKQCSTTFPSILPKPTKNFTVMSFICKTGVLLADEVPDAVLDLNWYQMQYQMWYQARTGRGTRLTGIWYCVRVWVESNGLDRPQQVHKLTCDQISLTPWISGLFQKIINGDVVKKPESKASAEEIWEKRVERQQ